MLDEIKGIYRYGGQMSLPKPFYEDEMSVIYHGNCLEILPKLTGIDLILTDPPYGVEWGYDEHQDGFEEWKSLMDAFIPMARATSKATVLCTSKIEGEAHIWKNHTPDWRMCWYKGAQPARSCIGFKDWEPLFVWGRCWRKPIHDYFHAATLPFGTHGHPCPKSDQWANWLLSRMLDKENQVVCDPFMGSGTTLRCAKARGIKSIGIELSEKYCSIAANRLAGEDLPLFNQ